MLMIHHNIHRQTVLLALQAGMRLNPIHESENKEFWVEEFILQIECDANC